MFATAPNVLVGRGMTSPSAFGTAALMGRDSGRFLRGDAPEDVLVVRRRMSALGALTSIPELAGSRALLDAYVAARARGAIVWMGKGKGIRPRAVDLTHLFDAGHMVSIRRIDRFVDPLVPLCRALEADLALPVGRIYVSAFLSLGHVGAAPHVDRVASFNVQLAGDKTWMVGGTPARFPRAPKILPDAMPREARRFVVRPGNVIFVPPGVLHATRGDTPSFAIGFCIESRPLGERWAARIRDRLRLRAELRAPPLFTPDRDDARARAAAELRAIADELEARATMRDENRDDTPMRLRRGIHAARTGEREVVLRTSTNERVIELDRELASLLDWVSREGAIFSLRRAAESFPRVPPARTRAAVRALHRAGLVEVCE